MGGMIMRESHRAIDSAVRTIAFVHWFGIWDGCAFVLSALFDAKGEVIPLSTLAAAASTSREAIQVRVSRLREAMDCEAIDTEAGEGYRLTEIGMAECKTAILRFRESLDGTLGVKEAAE